MIAIFDALVVLLPLIVIFTGMATTPLLLVFLLLIVLAVPKGTLCAPRTSLANYRLLLGLLAVMLLWPVVTSLWSITPARSLATALRIMLLYAAGAAAFIYTPALKPTTPCTLRYYAYCIVLVSALLVSEVIHGGGVIHWIDGLVHIDYERYIGKNVNRGLCALTVLIWPVMFGLYRLGRAKQAWVLFIVMALGIMVLHSLSAKLGLVAGAVTFFAVRRFPVWVPRAINILLPLYLLSFAVLFHILEPTLFAYPLVHDHLPASGIHRLHIWHELMQLAVQKPWFGWGMDTSRAAQLSPESLEFLGLKTPPLHPHSPSLQLLLELGIVGLLLAVAGLALLIREWVRMPQTDTIKRATAGALIVTYFATGVSSFGIWQYWWIAVLWIAAVLWRRMGAVAPAQPRL